MNKLTKKHETARQLRVIYTNPERLELGRQLADTHQALAQTNIDLDSIKTDFKSRIAAHDAKITDLSTKVSNGWRMEEVKCVWIMDDPKKGMKRLVRTDTAEDVETVEMTQSDKQAELALEEKKPEVGAGGVVSVPADSETPKA